MHLNGHQLHVQVQERYPVFRSELVSTAYTLAVKAHAGQQRKDGSSMLSHCIMTSVQLADLGLTAESVAAGLLHEVLRVKPSFRSQMEEFMPASVVGILSFKMTDVCPGLSVCQSSSEGYWCCM